MIAAAMALAMAEVVALRPLPRGTVLTEDIVAASAGADLSAYLGRQLTRPAFEGRPIRPSDLADPDLVARQSPVTVAFRRGALMLSVPGRALSAGAAGEVVTVLIEGRRAPLRAVVTGAGTVEVRP